MRRSISSQLMLVLSGLAVFLFNNCSAGFKSVGSGSNSSASVSTPTTPVNPTPNPPTPTPVPTPTPTPPTPTTYGLVHVFVGYGGLRATTLDAGTTWQITTTEQVPSGGTLSDCWLYREVAYGNGVFLALSATGGFGRISTSPDGVHWREFQTTTGFDSVVYGNNMWVGDTFTSTDGYAFNFRTPQITSGGAPYAIGGHTNMAYIDGHYIITGESNGIATSTDGNMFNVTLAGYTSPDSQAYFSNITKFAVGNGIVVGIGPQRTVTSTDDGETWMNHDNFFGYGSSAPSSSLQYNSFSSIVFYKGEFMIFGNSGAYGAQPTVWSSTDGLNWTETQFATGKAPNFVTSDTATELVGVGNSYGVDWSQASNWFFSIDGSHWLLAKTVAVNPPLASTHGYGIVSSTSGLASSDPTTTPTLPANVLLTMSTVQKDCGPVPAGE